MKIIHFVLVLALAVFALEPAAAVAAEKTGIVLMHGKWGTTKSKSPVVVLGKALASKGYLISTPEMPWSESRLYDKDYEATMAEIDKAVAGLKAKGATRIIVGGHSMGANAAFGYAARHDGLFAVLALAPGHVPSEKGQKKDYGMYVATAKKMVSSGKGKTKEKFTDINQGKKKTLNIPAEVYLSWFDPDGPANMPNNVASLKPGVALLWLTGDKDGFHKRGSKGFAFNKAPANPKSAYVVVSSGHGDAPKKGEKEIIKWLDSL
ncbi:MAG: alpha/beta hydrolase [Rhodospirillaceae bacterium]|nr:alpha/beta hydrolase [Rhodospirillaceae bacterium]